MLKVKEAKEELSTKSMADVQRETAWKWASRSAAMFEKLLECKKEKRLAAWVMAEEFYHEALEHASLVEGEEELLSEIRKAVHPYLNKAAKVMKVNPEDVDVI